MSSLRVWTIVVIFYQTIFSIIISWGTLNCSFIPLNSELHEATLIKLLYLYDPEACGQITFYNITMEHNDVSYSTIIWPDKNQLASTFRIMIRLWLCLHVLWFGLAIANLTHGHRHCGVYAVSVPFTFAGVTLLIVDLIYTGLFLRNIQVTKSQTAILNLFNTRPSEMKWINRPYPWPTPFSCDEDTSWISLLFAYVSCRGVVQWFINFWLIKDNYYESITAYHRLQKEKSRQRSKA